MNTWTKLKQWSAVIKNKLRLFFYYYPKAKGLLGRNIFWMFFFLCLYVVIGEAVIVHNYSPLIFHVYVWIGLIFLVVWFCVFIKTLIDIVDINTKEQQNKLSHKIASIISENIDHQLQSPLVAIKSSFEDLQANINKLTKLASPTGNRLIDKMVYGCRETDTKKCKVCALRNDCHKNKTLMQKMLRDSKEVQESIQKMQETLIVLKGRRKSEEKVYSSLYDVISDAVLTYRMLNKQRHIFNISSELKKYRVDKDKGINLINVFSNHINNSIYAHAFVIEFKFKKYEDGILTLHIVDDGDGIPPHILKKIWEYKTTSKESGRGFGMFFCKHIIEAMGGEERILTTKIGVGTVIEIKIPVERIEK